MALALTEANIEALPKVQFGHPDAPEDRKGEAARDVRRYARLPSVVCFGVSMAVGRTIGSYESYEEVTVPLECLHVSLSTGLSSIQ